ncbi:MAG: hypothetical protein ACRCWY_09860 [Cellulosilyticaceae bacterium]
MDYVFFIIKNNEVYVADYHKEEMKAITFKDKDYWEVYDRFDWMELMEYMNYPLNYNRFKNCRIRVLYHKPSLHQMLTETRSLFEASEGVEVGLLDQVLLAYCEHEMHFGFEMPYTIVYEGSFYTIQEQAHGWSIKALEDEPDEGGKSPQVITTVALCDFHKDQEAVPLTERVLLLSPANLYTHHEDRKQFLDTQYVIDEAGLSTAAYLQAGDVVFDYTKYVKKWFSRVEAQHVKQLAPQSGPFFRRREVSDDEREWAKKEALLGVIGMEGDTEAQVDLWLREIGYSHL